MIKKQDVFRFFGLLSLLELSMTFIALHDFSCGILRSKRNSEITNAKWSESQGGSYLGAPDRALAGQPCIT